MERLAVQPESRNDFVQFSALVSAAPRSPGEKPSFDNTNELRNFFRIKDAPGLLIYQHDSNLGHIYAWPVPD